MTNKKAKGANNGTKPPKKDNGMYRRIFLQRVPKIGQRRRRPGTCLRMETRSLGLSNLIQRGRRVPGCLLQGAIGAKKGPKNGPMGYFTT